MIEAEQLLDAVKQAKEAIAARIEALRLTITQCNEELAALCAKRVRKPKAEGKKRGRPAGSKNRKPEGVENAG